MGRNWLRGWCRSWIQPRSIERWRRIWWWPIEYSRQDERCCICFLFLIWNKYFKNIISFTILAINIIHEIMLFKSFRFCCQNSIDLHTSSILFCLVLNRREVYIILYNTIYYIWENITNKDKLSTMKKMYKNHMIGKRGKLIADTVVVNYHSTCTKMMSLD